MIRLIGAALVIAGTTAYGIAGVVALQRRSRTLAELLRTVAAMRSELVTRLTPVPTLISHLAEQSAEPVAAFLREVGARLGSLGEVTLTQIWSDALAAVPLGLNDAERTAFCEVPHALGRYDLAEQRVALLSVERQLERFATEAEERRRSDSKTRAFLGFAAGFFVVLILI